MCVCVCVCVCVHNFRTNCVIIPYFSGLSTGHGVIWTKVEREREGGRGGDGDRQDRKDESKEEPLDNDCCEG